MRCLLELPALHDDAPEQACGGGAEQFYLVQCERLSGYEAASQFSVLTPDIDAGTLTDAPVSGVPAKRMFCGERRCSKVSKARRLRRGERYGACTDEGDWG